jgi:hypothetical protein
VPNDPDHCREKPLRSRSEQARSETRAADLSRTGRRSFGRDRKRAGRAEVAARPRRPAERPSTPRNVSRSTRIDIVRPRQTSEAVEARPPVGSLTLNSYRTPDLTLFTSSGRAPPPCLSRPPSSSLKPPSHPRSHSRFDEISQPRKPDRVPTIPPPTRTLALPWFLTTRTQATPQEGGGWSGIRRRSRRKRSAPQTRTTTRERAHATLDPVLATGLAAAATPLASPLASPQSTGAARNPGSITHRAGGPFRPTGVRSTSFIAGEKTHPTRPRAAIACSTVRIQGYSLRLGAPRCSVESPTFAHDD